VLALQTAGTTAVTVDASQNVGIGTASPSGRLNLAVGASTSCILRFTANNTGTGAGDRGRLDFYSADNSGTAYQLGYMDYDRADGTGTASYIAFANRVAGTVAERMRIDSSGNLQFNSGYGSVAVAYGCRAWVNFNGTGTVAIRGSGNVSSITDNGTGDYTVNFTTAMADANYAVCGSAFGNVVHLIMSTEGTPSTTAVRVVTSNTVAVGDNSVVAVAIFR
jgi:hypothetical protein